MLMRPAGDWWTGEAWTDAALPAEESGHAIFRGQQTEEPNAAPALWPSRRGILKWMPDGNSPSHQRPARDAAWRKPEDAAAHWVVVVAVARGFVDWWASENPPRITPSRAPREVIAGGRVATIGILGQAEGVVRHLSVPSAAAALRAGAPESVNPDAVVTVKVRPVFTVSGAYSAWLEPALAGLVPIAWAGGGHSAICV